MEVEQQEYQTEKFNLSRVGQHSEKPAAEPEQHRGDVQAHAGHDNRDGDDAQVAAAAAHEVALAITELNMHDHEMQPAHLQDERKHDENEDAKLSSGDNHSDIDMERQQVLAKIVSDALSDDAQIRFQAVQAARKMLCGDSNPPVDKLIESGIVPILVKCLTVDTEPQLQFEAAWALTNIASGTSQQTRAVVEAGAVPLLVQLLNSPDSGVCEQAAWALGNIVSDGPELRDQVIELGVVAPLVNFINSESPVSLLRQVAYLISKIFRFNQSPPPTTTLQELLPGLYKLIQHHDIDILHNSVWVVANIFVAGNDYFLMIVDYGFVKHVVPLLEHTEEKVLKAALQAVVNIVGSSPELRDQVIELGVVAKLVNFINSESPVSLLSQVALAMAKIFKHQESPPPATILQELLPALQKLIQHHDIDILHNSVCAVANIADAGNYYFQMIVDRGFMKHVVSLLGHTEDKVKESALLAVGNISSGTVDQTQAVLDEGALSYFPALFQHPENKIKELAVWCICNITAGIEQHVKAVIDANLIPLVVMCLRTGDCETQKEAAWTISNLAASKSVDQIRYCVEQSVIPPLCELLNVKDTEIITVALLCIKKILRYDYTKKYVLKMVKRQIKECGGLGKIKALRKHQDEKIQKLAIKLLWTYL